MAFMKNPSKSKSKIQQGHFNLSFILVSGSQWGTAYCLACLLLFVPVCINTNTAFVKAFADLWETVLWKTTSICYLQDTSPSFTSRFGPKGLPFSCAWASADTFKHSAERLSTCASASLCMNLVVTARPRGRDAARVSSHFCHVCCGDKQEGIFNRRRFLCWSVKAQGRWPSRHSANPICFPRRWRVFKWCRWWHYVCLILWDSLFCFYSTWYVKSFFQVNCPWHIERFDITKKKQQLYKRNTCSLHL